MARQIKPLRRTCVVAGLCPYPRVLTAVFALMIFVLSSCAVYQNPNLKELPDSSIYCDLSYNNPPFLYHRELKVEPPRAQGWKMFNDSDQNKTGTLVQVLDMLSGRIIFENNINLADCDSLKIEVTENEIGLDRGYFTQGKDLKGPEVQSIKMYDHDGSLILFRYEAKFGLTSDSSEFFECRVLKYKKDAVIDTIWNNDAGVCFVKQNGKKGLYLLVRYLIKSQAEPNLARHPDFIKGILRAYLLDANNSDISMNTHQVNDTTLEGRTFTRHHFTGTHLIKMHQITTKLDSMAASSNERMAKHINKMKLRFNNMIGYYEGIAFVNGRPYKSGSGFEIFILLHWIFNKPITDPSFTEEDLSAFFSVIEKTELIESVEVKP